MALNSFQALTYFYVNIVPQWQCINNGNWAFVERAVRNMATEYKKEYLIYTGTQSVLSLNGHEIYLAPGKQLPVPNYLWKVVIDDIRNKGISFVTLNNPYAANCNYVNQLCQSVCYDHGWFTHEDIRDKLNDVTRGCTICCSINNLKSLFSNIPSPLIAERILRGKY